MSKPRIVGPAANDKFSPENVAKNNAEMRAKATPEVQRQMDEVDAAIAEENANMDRQFEGDAKLRAWAKELLGFQISMTQIERLQAEISSATAGKPFSYQGVLLIKTAFGTIDRLDRYVFALERTIVDLMAANKSVAPTAQQFTDPSFFGLIKLAFKGLFKRSK